MIFIKTVVDFHEEEEDMKILCMRRIDNISKDFK